MSTVKELKKYLKNNSYVIDKRQKNNSYVIDDDQTIEEVVTQYVDFSNGKSNDWNKVYCAVCGDGSRTQGPRGGWHFQGENARYNCFNCGIKGAFSPFEDIPMSRDMKKVFKSFGIPKKEYSKILFRIRSGTGLNKRPPKNKEIDPSKILLENSFPFPDYLMPLKDNLDSTVGKKCLEILDDHHISVYDHPFYISSGETKLKNSQDKINSKITKNRLIIPITFENELLLLQARDLFGKSNKKYINIGKINNCLYGLDRLQKNHKYVFVTEGFWDAFHLNGVATISNQLSKGQIKILESIDKPKVVVPDRGGDYNTLAKKSVDLGWGISAPYEFRNYKDVTDTITKYGKLYSIYIFMKNVTFGEKCKLIIKDL